MVGNKFLEFQLDKHKTTLMAGRNGVGKSQILDALCFVLYGKAFRNINKPQLVNSITKKDLLVEIEFRIGQKEYFVRRGIKPSIFEIYVDGKLLPQNSAVRDYQEILELNIIKINYKSFGQIVALGLANYTPFMQLSAAARREVIEDLLDIQIFSVMNSLLKNRIIENKNSIQDNQYNLKLSESKLAMDKKRVADLKKNNKEMITQKISKIKEIKKEITKISNEIIKHQEKLNKLQSKLSNSKKVKDKLDQFKELKVKLSHQNSKLLKEVKFYNESENCPTCKQIIDETFKKSTLEKRNKNLEELSKALSTVEKNLNSLNKSIDEIKELHQHSIELSNTISSLSFTKNSNLETINNIQEEINQLREKNESYSQDNRVRQELVEEYNRYLQEKESLIKIREVYGIANQLLKDGGIKTKIVKQYVPIINKLINKHLAALDFFIDFEIDENFEEKIKSRGRDQFSYESFSQGQRLRIDLALMFTWRAISKLRNSTNTNLLILDEILDSSLDDTGVEDFMKILSKMTSDQNTFIISHKVEQLSDKFDNILKFSNNKNFTAVVEGAA